MFIVLIGPPGAGKGTYSRMLNKKFGFYHFCMGDILREKEDDEIKRYIDKGEVIPLNTLERLLKNFSSDFKFHDVIFDGIPRDLEQSKIFKKFLIEIEKKIDLVIGFKVDKELILERIKNRLICPNCKKIYNSKLLNLEKNICELCSSQIVKREDDINSIVLRRIERYEKVTPPLVNLYQEEGIYKEIDAGKNIMSIYQEIVRIIEEKL